MVRYVEADNLSKRYGKCNALRGVSFYVEGGEIFGLIGPDGAGKSTLFRILTTLILPDGGSGRVCGLDIIKDYKEIRSRVGYMPGRFSLYQDLSVEENINFFATLFGTSLKENYSLVKDIYSYLEPFKKRKAGALSGGMKQKLALSCALIHRPEVLFLDEPTTGVDPVSRKEFWVMLKRLKEQGLSIVVSTPYMDEADRCDRIALIREGAFMGTDTPQGIVSKFDLPLLSVSGENMPALLRRLRGIPQLESSYAFGESHHVVVKRGGFPEGSEVAELESILREGSSDAVKVMKIAPGIEDCYMYLDTLYRDGTK